MTNSHVINGIEIKTWNVCPPVPVRNWDWAAWVKDSDEETGLEGHGATEQEAIEDLLFQLEEMGD